MTERRLTVALALVVLVAGMAAPIATAAMADDAITGTRATAIPPTPGEPSTHRVEARIGPGLANETLSSVVVDYAGTDISLANVEYQDLDASVVRNRGTTDDEQVSLPAATYASNESSVSVGAAGNLDLQEGDWVVVTIDGIHNPETMGDRNVSITVAGDTAATATAPLSIRYPPPSLQDQGLVGDVHRIAIHTPDGSGGFVVARVDGDVVGTTDLPRDRNLHMDVGLDSLVSADVAPNATVTLTAYRDTNDDGEYTPEVDEPWIADDKPVTITVESAPATTVTTTSTVRPSTTTAGPPRTSHTSPTPATTATTTPGFGPTTVVLAGALVVLLRRW